MAQLKIVLTGGIGSGKTTVCRALLNRLDPNTKVAVITNTRLTGKQLLQSICEEFNLWIPGNVGKVTLFSELNAFLVDQYRMGQNVVLIVDEAQNLRPEVLDQARLMVEHSAAPDDRIMVVALNGGLRVEQPFTSDHGRVLETLTRMEYDLTLWEPSFYHLNERVFFEPFEALLDVLSFEPGGKALVLFSDHPGRADTDDLFFADLAASAAASRCSIYPVEASGLANTRPG